MELDDDMVKVGNKDLQGVGGMRLVQDRHLGYKALKKENSFITIHCHFMFIDKFRVERVAESTICSFLSGQPLPFYKKLDSSNGHS